MLTSTCVPSFPLPSLDGVVGSAARPEYNSWRCIRWKHSGWSVRYLHTTFQDNDELMGQAQSLRNHLPPDIRLLQEREGGPHIFQSYRMYLSSPFLSAVRRAISQIHLARSISYGLFLTLKTSG